MEILSLWLILGCVYLSEALWWTTPSTLILTGSRLGDFRVRRGASIELRGTKGFFLTTPVPPFRYAFECPLLDTSSSPKRPKRSQTEQLVTQALSLASPLRRLGEGLFLYLFVLVPLAIATMGLLPVWLPLLAILLIWLTAIVIVFKRSWQRWQGETVGGWKSAAALMVVSPLGATRAADRFTRTALAGVGGLHLASIVAAPEEFCRIARLIYFDDESPVDDTVKAEIDRIVESMRLRSVFDAPPVRESGMMGFCRRCHTQVMRETGTCPDCVTQAIAPFDGETEKC